jgi:hypothetical protein
LPCEGAVVGAPVLAAKLGQDVTYGVEADAVFGIGALWAPNNTLSVQISTSSVT